MRASAGQDANHGRAVQHPNEYRDYDAALPARQPQNALHIQGDPVANEDGSLRFRHSGVFSALPAQFLTTTPVSIAVLAKLRYC
jgi:hypothetical protein